MSRSGLCIATMLAALTTAPLAAHHSYVEFDQQNPIEIEGTLVAAAWQNPHSRLTVAAADGARWDIESSAANGLRRAGAPLELFEVGSKVKVAGWPSTRSSSRLFGTNILSAGGQELILFRAPPRWGGGAIGLERQAVVASDGAAGRERTIFRTWGSAYARPGIPDDPDASPSSLFRVPWPLTEAAREARARFDEVKYNQSLSCAPKNMPYLMIVPTPTDFVDRGESILFRSEEFDAVRTIHMNSREDPSALSERGRQSPALHDRDHGPVFADATRGAEALVDRDRREGDALQLQASGELSAGPPAAGASRRMRPT